MIAPAKRGEAVEDAQTSIDADVKPVTLGKSVAEPKADPSVCEHTHTLRQHQTNRGEGGAQWTAALGFTATGRPTEGVPARGASMDGRWSEEHLLKGEQAHDGNQHNHATACQNVLVQHRATDIAFFP